MSLIVLETDQAAPFQCAMAFAERTAQTSAGPVPQIA
jgi:hypothetical protein